MTITKEELERLHEASKPLRHWMLENCHPYCVAHVDQESVKLTEDIASIPTEQRETANLKQLVTTADKRNTMKNTQPPPVEDVVKPTATPTCKPSHVGITFAEMRALTDARVAGKKIQRKSRHEDCWHRVYGDYDWEPTLFEYRVDPNQDDESTCSVCNHCNINLLNLGYPGKPKLICQSCCQSKLEELESLKNPGRIKTLKEFSEQARHEHVGHVLIGASIEVVEATSYVVKISCSSKEKADAVLGLIAEAKQWIYT